MKNNNTNVVAETPVRNEKNVKGINMNQNNSYVVAETPVWDENYVKGINMNQNNSFAAAETPAFMNKNTDVISFLSDADSYIRPVRLSDTLSYAQSIANDCEIGYVRQIYCSVNAVSENHAEGHYKVERIGFPTKMELDCDFVYDGEIGDGFPTGNGTLKFINVKSEMLSSIDLPEETGEGWTYSGSLQYGIPHGEGLLSGPNGTVFSGTFKNGLLIVEDIKPIPVPGNYRYTDAFIPDCPEKRSDTKSKAKMIVYEGIEYLRFISCTVNAVSENHAEGHYVVTWINAVVMPFSARIELDSDFIYDGEIDDGFPNGNGTLKFINVRSAYFDDTDVSEGKVEGWTYSGSLEYGIPHGKGHLSGPNGTVFSGTFKNGLLIEGKKIQPDDFGRKGEFVTVTGTFYHGIPIGDSYDLQTSKIHYHGHISHRFKFDCRGRCEYAKGMIMDGFWDQGHFISGLVKMIDGSLYIGQWSDEIGYMHGSWRGYGEPQGFGTLYSTNGNVSTGYWDKAILIKGKIFSSDGWVREVSHEQTK